MKKIIIILSLILLSSFVLAEPLRVTLDTPSVTYRDLKIGDTINGIIKVTNNNPFSINVTLTKPDLININFNTLKTELNPNESYEFNYDILLENSGNYSASINVLYSTNEENITPQEFSLQSIIKFININEANTPETSEGSSGGGSSGNKGKTTTIIQPIKSNITKDDAKNPIENSDNSSKIELQENTSKQVEETQTTKSNNNSTYLIIAIVIIISILIAYFLVKSKSKGKPLPQKEKLLDDTQEEIEDNKETKEQL
jgi:hypothetical protein